ncbi:TonB-dependent receptor [Thalassobaculum fulvum]|uniref:TonB-dependent receptor n=1 Tax=Thalassobaculum fulvum TaxID=1633335 RepID=A0A919CSE5_9PROT|nr:TonB-dependent copper receptor [Thalassobaculum fulvum]GHD63122.1 TonB-dependent receptor [Thalassobaculum fulvum]
MTQTGGREGLHSILLAGVAAAAASATPATAQTTATPTTGASMPAVVVEAPRLTIPATATTDPRAADVLPAADGGDYLRSVPGVSGTRMGGHGIDPVIRGLQGNQLNITSDGAYLFGGCPNRMDPPSSFAPVETFDRVTVSQGYQTVTRGPGGPGGHVAFERTAPVLADGKPYEADVGGGWDANGNTREGYADVAAGSHGAYVRAVGAVKEAENYDDGSGNEIRSGFSQRSIDLTAGYKTAGGAAFSIGTGFARVDDALYEGAAMDAPLDESRTLRGRLAVPLQNGPVSEVRADAYVTAVDHVMDNYSLRDWTAAMAMRVDSESDTYGGSLAADLPLGATLLTVGLDVQRNQREALRYRGMSDSNVTQLNSLMWPDTDIRQFGVFAEGTTELTGTTRLVLGARYDRVDAELGRAGEVVASTGRSANDLYRLYYGTTGDDRAENNLGGLARLEYDLNPATTVHVGFSRSVRTADATERSMASDMMASSWVGNPDIEPEAHHQAEIGVQTGAKAWSVGAIAYVDRVGDFILRDTARGQDGIQLSNGATVYRNVDALLSGFTVNGRYRFGGNWVVSGDATYTYGSNLDDRQPLAQIPPLEGKVGLAYEADGWSIGTTLRGAMKQTRVDSDPATGSGRDAGETPGWLTQDIYASVDMVAPFKLRVGVTNLFDRTYAYHLNRSNSFDPTEVQVNEPGRSVYLRVSASF